MPTASRSRKARKIKSPPLPRLVQAEEPLRAELLSLEQLAELAGELAAEERLARHAGADRLLPRLDQNEAVLVHTYQLVNAAVLQEQSVAPASEWLLDNFYLIEEQIRLIRRHLPKRYSLELPQLAGEPLGGYPRVYGLALNLVSHLDGRLDSEALNRFVAAYQERQPLRLGELWAWPIMLRLALVEDLRRVAARIAASRRDRNLANHWAEQLLAAAEESPDEIIVALAALVRAKPALSPAFVTELVRRLQGQNVALAPALDWLQQMLARSSESLERMLQRESQAQAADHVSIGNCINSLRFIDALDWRQFVESQSVVEKTLAADPAGAYTRMDFASRDRYRHAVELLARCSGRDIATEKSLAEPPWADRNAAAVAAENPIGHPTGPVSAGPSTRWEAAIAQEVLRRAQAAARQYGREDYRAHVGYYLLEPGIRQLQRDLLVRLPWRRRLQRLLRRFPLTAYLGAIALLAGAAAAGLLARWGPPTVLDWRWWGLAAATLLAASSAAVTAVNHLCAWILDPMPPPRLDFSKGVPEECRTLVAIPSFLENPPSIQALLEALEVRYLSNRDANIFFTLLTDFRDASEQVRPEDEALLRCAMEGIEALNRRYGGADGGPFYLFHRPRLWNKAEKRWMGYERKRGKLAELAEFLRGGAADRFLTVVGDTAILPTIRYVITLDADTELPYGSAAALIGAMAHPLNRPEVDARRGVVKRGYGILQPRVTVSLPLARRSRFARLFAGEPGLDPYTRAVSDVYQDLFQEGSFFGKGIFDVDVFHQVLQRRFPENRILSHDLLEGCHARCGLISDVQLYEDYPWHYGADANRRHRWIRGDWQLSPWLLPRVRRLEHPRADNPLSALSRWKLFDNLRRSLVAPAVLALMLLALTWLRAWGPWLVAAWLMLTAAPALAILEELLRKSRDLGWRTHLQWWRRVMLRELAQGGLAIVFLPAEAVVCLDAIGRALLRMHVTHRRLLEWHTSGAVQQDASPRIRSFLKTMWTAPVIGLFTLAAVAELRPTLLAPATILAALWVLSPAVAWLLSRPLVEPTIELDAGRRDFLRMVARRTWRYFEQFAGAGENFLPADNFQEYPQPVTAHRTSPTNIGLALLANAAAHDFAWLTMDGFLDRTRVTLDSLDKLPRYRGHFFNWYDTHSLRPLNPQYVSSVDSGNLAGHLLVLRAALQAAAREPLVSARVAAGILDTLLALQDDLQRRIEPPVAAASPETPVPLALAGLLKALYDVYRRDFSRLCDVAAALHQGEELLAQFQDREAAPTGEAAWWLQALQRQHHEWLEELAYVAPWLALGPAPADAVTQLAPGQSGGESRWAYLQASLAALDGNPSLRAAGDLVRQALGHLELLIPATKATADRAVNAPAVEVWPESAASQLDASRLEDARSPRPAGDQRTSPTALPQAGATPTWAHRLQIALRQADARIRERLALLERLAGRCRQLAEMEVDFLYDRGRKLFAIGFNVSANRLDNSYYDLLASESRLGSYVAIILGRVGQEHWFALGRQITGVDGQTALLSWSGSMFEYLMPLLVMPTFRNTLLDQTCQTVVDRNIEYMRRRGLPWGVSESGFYAFDTQMNYQYRAFGVPGLGFKRRLGEDTVIAPYASALALLVKPREACANLQRLAQEGRLGRYGFYEAVDYTPARVPPGETAVTVRSFMAHHQGMSLLALEGYLLDQPMQRRFLADPLLRCGELLLQEKIPRVNPVFPHAVEVLEARRRLAPEEPSWRIFDTPQTPRPEAHLLSNGRYHVAITAAGGGRSVCRGLALLRWREDFTRDDAGFFCYIHDVTAGRYWSNPHQPVCHRGSSYAATFSEGKAEFRRRDGALETFTQLVVSPEDDIELRRLTLTNRARHPRRVELTTYGEVALTPPADEAAHPAFHHLFVQTEALPELQGLLARRRARGDEKPPWLLHLATVHGPGAADFSWQTDRAAFLGRGRDASRPQAMDQAGLLHGATGTVLDPILAIRLGFTIEPEQTVLVDVILGLADSRESALALAQRYSDRRWTDRVLELSWSHQRVLLHQLNIREADAQWFGRLAGALLYRGPGYRGPASALLRNRHGQSGLWGFGISGDVPMVLLRLADAANLSLVRQVIDAHAYWRLKGLTVDLMIWAEDLSVYRQALPEQILGLITAGPEAKLLDRPGGIFVRRYDQIADEDRTLVLSAAAVVLSDAGGSLVEQIRAAPVESEASIPRLAPVSRPLEERPPGLPVARPDLRYFNSFGGLTQDGREYVMTLRPDRLTPAPWCNVIANDLAGTVVSESGGMYTWVGNAHEFRLTPWYNDAVTAVSGEAFYIRDDHTGYFWSPTMRPAPGQKPGLARHGFGYSVFERTEQQIHSELWVYLAHDAPVKFCVLKLTNFSPARRRLSILGYWEWVLGEQRGPNAMHIVTEMDENTGALLARNLWSADFADQIAFVDSSEAQRTHTGDRVEFLGRNGSPEAPAALRRLHLSGTLGGGLDPCAALHSTVDLPPGGAREVVFLLGAVDSRRRIQDLLARYRSPAAARRELEEVWKYWNHTLGTIYLETPDGAANALANGWLLYQTISCRLHGRSGFYQSGGAFGFRDQLQDAMAAALVEPALLRAHLLRAAGRQFAEGDVQHWWHPPSGRGVRTRCSDDALWLPLATCRYVQLTGDTGVLEESVPFLEGRALNPHEDSYYDRPGRGPTAAALYEHCVRAIKQGLRWGRHGLPLIGSGDWNDGYNRVGPREQGESVWLAFFLRYVLREFEPLAARRGDAETRELCLRYAAELETAVEAHAWDGQWYLRAFFDDGTPLGSAKSDQGRIDSLPQSWAVLSATGAPQRRQAALAAVEQHLVRYPERLIQLLAPPFDHPAVDPGYIAGYAPGVRENGGQYTHAALWAIMAFAQAGQADKAWELFCLINPLRHGGTARDVETYRVEPYVVAADVYAAPQHLGRGGWTWYTGAAGWMYRLLVETFVGYRRQADRLWFEPAAPKSWGPFQCHYRYYDTFYHIFFSGGGRRCAEVKLDGEVKPDGVIPLVNDRHTHRVEISVGG